MSKILDDVSNPEGKELNNHLILIIDNDARFAEGLGIQLETIGYRSVYIDDLTDLKKNIRSYAPKAIFVDLDYKDAKPEANEIFNQRRDAEEIQCPVIYVSVKDDITARLKAVRARGNAFLNKDFTINDLKNTLDQIAPLHRSTSYRVLIIDDDKSMNVYCTAVLENAGINVSCLESTDNIFQDIVNFDPDVILLDMYMPNINGLEMASIIRQNHAFSAIPIVIMSGETDINKQFVMRSVGADDFILKPFKPHHLVEIILNRIQRSKQTKKLINTDGLTGLLLFPKIRDQISNLMESCIRYNLQFSVAFLDLDHFKQVNDTYGHLMGDQILREFADFLISRLRRSDMVTRYGGEEFAIIFPYTNGDNAILALNSIRDSFSKTIQHADAKEFKVTFSAGISSIGHQHDLESLLSAADVALYKAKEDGGNRIYLAD